MARAKDGTNKSEAIREYLTANPDAGAKAVVEALGKKGIEVKEGLVYAVKGSMKEKAKRKKKIAKAAMAAAKPSSNGQASKSDAVALIHDVRALAKRSGGYEQLMELVKALAE